MDHRALVTIVVALSLVRCGDDTPVPEEDLGTALTEQNQVRPDEIESALAWSASGREVAYLRSPLFAPDRPQVRADRDAPDSLYCPRCRSSGPEAQRCAQPFAC